MTMVSDQQTLSDVADTLQQLGVQNLPAYVSNINVMEHAAAYTEIVARLAARGFLLAQITGSDQGPYWERQYTVWRVLGRLTRLVKPPPGFREAFDVRQEMAEAELTTGGAWQPPQGVAGQVQTGPIQGEQVRDCFDRQGGWRGEW